jgi:hypothetical protein
MEPSNNIVIPLSQTCMPRYMLGTFTHSRAENISLLHRRRLNWLCVKTRVWRQAMRAQRSAAPLDGTGGA